MIGVVFQFGSEVIEVRILETNIYFRTGGEGFATIDQIKLSKDGVVKEHPDLADNPEWRVEAVKRFKEKIKSLEGETQRMRYIIQDLSQYGYVPLYFQRAGHRPQKIRQ